MSEQATFALLDGLLEETIGGVPVDVDFVPTVDEMREGGRAMERTFQEVGIDHDVWVQWAQRDGRRTVRMIDLLMGGEVSEDVLAGFMGTQLTQGFLMGIGLMKWKAEQGGAA